MNRKNFIVRLGGIYEHSPWVAEQLWDRGGVELQNDTEALHAAMVALVEAAPRPVPSRPTLV